MANKREFDENLGENSVKKIKLDDVRERYLNQLDKRLKFLHDFFERKKKPEHSFLRFQDMQFLDMNNVEYITKNNLKKFRLNNLRELDVKLRKNFIPLSPSFSYQTFFIKYLEHYTNRYNEIYFFNIDYHEKSLLKNTHKNVYEYHPDRQRIFIICAYDHHAYLVYWNRDDNVTQWIDPNGMFSFYSDFGKLQGIIREKFPLEISLCTNNLIVNFNEQDAGYFITGDFNIPYFYPAFLYSKILDLPGYCLFIIYLLLHVKFLNFHLSFEEIIYKLGYYFFESKHPTSMMCSVDSSMHCKLENYMRRYYFFILYNMVYIHIKSIKEIYDVIPLDSQLKKEKFIFYYYFLYNKIENFLGDNLEKYKKIFKKKKVKQFISIEDYLEDILVVNIIPSNLKLSNVWSVTDDEDNKFTIIFDREIFLEFYNRLLNYYNDV